MKKKFRIIPLGGLNEIGKNLTAYEYGKDIILVDCGVKFPEDDMLGVDLVIPDFSYIIENASKIRGLFVTHGHEDHIGAIPFLLREIDVPIYASKFTIGLISRKLKEHTDIKKPRLITIDPKNPIKIGGFELDFIRVTHSIPDALSFVISTDMGKVIHTGDFKVDYTPIDDMPIDLQKFADIGAGRVLALLADSTNADRHGFSMSEASVGATFESIFRTESEHRIIVASFSSNVHRLQQVINAAHLYGRKVSLVGRSMLNTTQVAEELGYINIPSDIKLDLQDIDAYPDNEVCIITTGTQGERLAGLSRMANNEHHSVKVREGDTVILSSSAIPGNERAINGVINKLYALGANVIYNELADVHVSGHAKREELKLIQSLVKPEFFIPVHGEYAHLMQHVSIAQELGMSKDNIFVMENGDVLEYDGESFKIVSKVQAGAVLIDGSASSDIGNKVLKERQIMSREGVLSVALCLDDDLELLAEPQLSSRGFVSADEEAEILKAASEVIVNKIYSLSSKGNMEYGKLKQQINAGLNELFYKRTMRRPLIIINIVRAERA